jgi:hypothetical protein
MSLQKVGGAAVAIAHHSSKGDQSEKPNKKRALIALSALLMLLKVHPSGFEPETFGSVVDA